MRSEILSRQLLAELVLRGERKPPSRTEMSRRQRQALSRLVSTLGRLPAGSHRGLDRLAGRPDLEARFRAEVAPTTYADVAPLIDRVARGERDVMFPGRAVALAQTSGTTAEATAGEKLIPQSFDLLRHHTRGGLTALVRAILAGGPSMLAGKILMIGGSTDLTPNEAGIPVGDLSGICSAHVPRAFERHYEPGRTVALERNWQTKIARMVARCGPRDIRLVAGLPSWALVLFSAVCARRNVGRVCEAWPHLSAMLYGGHAIEPFLPGLAAHLHPETLMLEVYAASEAFLAIGAQAWPLGDGRPAPLEVLVGSGTYVEFLPEGGSPEDAVGPENLEPGALYIPLVTTPGGLVRFDVGDRLLGAGSGRVWFAGRRNTQLSVFGEHVEGWALASALGHACQLTLARVNAYHVAPGLPTPDEPRGFHEWWVEFSQAPRSEQDFATALDAYLLGQVQDYAAHRAHDAQLMPPRVVNVPAGTFARYLERRGQLGGQHKVPESWKDRSIAEELAQCSLETPRRATA